MSEIKTDIFMVVVDRDGWTEYFPHFSPKARVVVLYLQGQPIPFDVDLDLATFLWPQPIGNTTVGVAEPDMSGFRARLEGAGVEIPSFDDIRPDFMNGDIEEFLVDEEATLPGSVVEQKCPECGLPELYVVSELDQISLSRDYAIVSGKPWYISPKTGYMHVSGMVLSAVRCPDCLCTFLREPGSRTLIFHSVEIG